MKLQILTAVKISTVIFWGYEPCTLKDGHQCPKRRRHRSDMQSSASQGPILSSTWDALWKKRLHFACRHSINDVHLPPKASKIGPYDAAIAWISASLHSYNESIKKKEVSKKYTPSICTFLQNVRKHKKNTRCQNQDYDLTVPCHSVTSSLTFQCPWCSKTYISKSLDQ